jgi:hypothetical protein
MIEAFNFLVEVEHFYIVKKNKNGK